MRPDGLIKDELANQLRRITGCLQRYVSAIRVTKEMSRLSYRIEHCDDVIAFLPDGMPFRGSRLATPSPRYRVYREVCLKRWPDELPVSPVVIKAAVYQQERWPLPIPIIRNSAARARLNLVRLAPQFVVNRYGAE